MYLIGSISCTAAIFLLIAYSIYRTDGGCMKLIILTVIFAGLITFGWHQFNKPLNDDHLKPVTWITEPKTRWPQIVLTNDAQFKGHTPLKGASGFLLQTTDGRIRGATARHLLGYNGGVQPELIVTELDPSLVSWKMFPRTRPSQAIAFSGIRTPKLARRLDSPVLDWLILTPKEGARLDRVEVLQIRHRPAEVGETVHLIGCPYIADQCRQRVYSGRVTLREAYNMFRFTVDPPVDLRGFSGAPIIDARGHLVGVLTLGFEPDETSKGHVEGGGQDVGGMAKLLRP